MTKGVVLNAIDGSGQVTDERITKLTSDLSFGSLQTLFSQQSVWKVHVKRVASVSGQIISLSSYLASVTRIMTMHLFSVVFSASPLRCEVFLSDNSIFWASNFNALKGTFFGGVQLLPVRVSFSDDSNSA